MNESEINRLVYKVQRTEETESLVYLKLSKLIKDANNAAILAKMGKEEKKHAEYWERITGVKAKPNMTRVFITVLFARLFGITFVLKLMEKREGTGSKTYDKLAAYYPESTKFSEEEVAHEQKLLNMLDEESLKFVGSIVLGLNDALVELTGALAGFTLALNDNKIISLVGLVTGISAALSMASSDYLSSKAEGDTKAKKSAIYTGFAYLITVAILILPFLLFTSKILALGATLLLAITIIFVFNYYLAIAKDLNFKQRFVEMTLISMGVALISFVIGYVLKIALGIDI